MRITGSGQCLGKVRSRREAVGGNLGQRSRHALLYSRRYRVAHRPERWNRIDRVPGEQLLRRGPDERWLPREHLVEHATERVQIAPSVQLPGGGGLLRAHVGRSPQCQAGLGEPVLTRGADGPCHSEVRHHRLVTLQEDVFRFDVAVDDVVRVGVAQGAQYLAGDPHRSVDRKLALARQQLPEGFALHVRHGVPQPARRLARVVYGQDVRMPEAGGDPDFQQKPLRSEGGGQLGSQDLQGDGSVVPDVVGEIYRGHAAASELSLDAIAVGQGGREEVGCVGQRGNRRMPLLTFITVEGPRAALPRHAPLLQTPSHQA